MPLPKDWQTWPRRACRRCGGAFQPRVRWQVYCSKRCRWDTWLIRRQKQNLAEGEPTPTEISRVMRSLGRRGGLKGGPASMALLSPEERREKARKAALTRWGRRP